MRYINHNKRAPLPLILMLCLLLLLTALPTSARMSGSAMGKPMARGVRWSGGTVTDTDGIIGNGTRGADAPCEVVKRMTGRATNGIRRATDRVVRGVEDVTQGIGNAVGDMARDIGNGTRDLTDGDGSSDMTQDGIREQGESENGTVTDHTTDGTENGNATDSPADPNNGTNADSGIANDDVAGDGALENGTEESSGGVIGWVIAVLVVLGIVLVVLALLPKKNRDRG